MSFNVGPFKRITAFDVPPDDKYGPFWILSGEQIITGPPTFIHRRGSVGGFLLGNGDASEWSLVFRNPADPQWLAFGATFYTEQASGGANVSQMHIDFTGQFEDEERQLDPPFNPNDIDWLDGIVITVASYGDLPPLGGPELVRTYVGGGINRTKFSWVEPTTSGIALLPLSADSTEASRYEITYPGSEDV